MTAHSRRSFASVGKRLKLVQVSVVINLWLSRRTSTIQCPPSSPGTAPTFWFCVVWRPASVAEGVDSLRVDGDAQRHNVPATFDRTRCEM
jgi:hypothetical protein